jgi:beta-glucosidase
VSFSHSRRGLLEVSGDVENVGRRTGDEVVQLYLRQTAASVTRPVKELKGFERITLEPAEKRRVRFIVTHEHLGFHNRQLRFVVEPGTFQVMVGTSSEGDMTGSFEVTDK